MSQRVLQEWKNRVEAEYTSAAVTGQVLQWMIVMAFPDELIDTAMRIVRDELDHAQLSHDCYIDMGGDATSVALHAEQLLFPLGEEGVYGAFTRLLIRNFCLGETFAVPLFHAMYAGTTHPLAKKTLERILRDEAVHRAFGWDVLDALLERDIPQIRSYIEKVLPTYVEQFRSAYASKEQSKPLSESERAMGLINLSDYRDIWIKTYESDVKKRFVKREIQAP